MRIHQPLGPDSFPRSMLENTTEFDWDELPDYLKDVLRGAAREINEWAAQQENPIVGEVVPDAAALPQADLTPHIEQVQTLAASLGQGRFQFDIGAPEPKTIVMLTDCTDGGDNSSPAWSKTYTPGEWKGYKDGGKVYLQWDELVRRWGPLTTAGLEWPKPSE